MRATFERVCQKECTYLIVANFPDKRSIATQRSYCIDGVGSTSSCNHGLARRSKSLLNREVLLIRDEVHTALGEGQLIDILIAHKNEDIGEGIT